MPSILARLSCVHANTSPHYSDVIMNAMGFQITNVSIVSFTVCSGADQRKHQNSVSLAFLSGIHQWLANSPHKGPVTWKIFPFDDVIILYRSCDGKLGRILAVVPHVRGHAAKPRGRRRHREGHRRRGVVPSLQALVLQQKPLTGRTCTRGPTINPMPWDREFVKVTFIVTVYVEGSLFGSLQCLQWRKRRLDVVPFQYIALNNIIRGPGSLCKIHVQICVN